MTDPSVVVRPATAQDEPFLLAVYASTRAAELALTGWTSAQQDAFVQQQYGAQRSHYEATFAGADLGVIEVDGVPCGRLWLWRAADQVRLLDIALLSDWQHRGIGEGLLERLQAEAAERGLPLRHAVAADNDGARRFYDRLGFVVEEDVGSHLFMRWEPPASA